MSGYAAYDRQHDLPSERNWRLKDVVYLLGTLGAAGTLATVVIGTTVLGGGFLLLVGLPLFLLFSPILVPGAIIATLIGGGLLAALLATGGTLWAGSWLWRYLQGKHPYGADIVDSATGRVKGVYDYAKEKSSEVIGYGTHKASEALDYGQQRTQDMVSRGQQQLHGAQKQATGAAA